MLQWLGIRTAGGDRGQQEAEDTAVLRPEAMHEAVFMRSTEEVRRLLNRKEMAFFDVSDEHGNSPLLLAVKIGAAEIVIQLLKHGADMTIMSEKRFPLMDEALLSCRQYNVIRELYVQMKAQILHKWETVLEPKVMATLAKLPDFSLEMHCRLEANFLFNKILSLFAPSETYKIHKRGSAIRIDFTIKGFHNNMTPKRGNLSMLLAPRPNAPGSCNLFKIDHDKKKFKNMLAFLKKPSELQLRHFVLKLLKASEKKKRIEAFTFNVQDIKFYQAKDIFGRLKSENLHDKWACTLWHGAGELKVMSFSKTYNPEADMTFMDYFHRPAPHFASGQRDANEDPFDRDMDQVDGPEDCSSDSESSSSSSSSTHAAVRPGKSRIVEKQVINNKTVTTIWVTNDLPISSADLLPLMDVIQFENQQLKIFQDILEQASVVFADGAFPAKLQIPLIMGVKASISLNRFTVKPEELLHPDEFMIPATYVEVM